MSHTEQANYPTDLTDEQWQILRKLLPQPSHRGAPRTACRRAVVNAILYVLRSGCAWRLLPHEFPKWKTVYGIFRTWRDDGTWPEDPRFAPGQAATSGGPQDVPQCGDHRQSDGQDPRGRRPAGLRRGQEGQRPQAPRRCRHAGTDSGRRGPPGERPGLRWGGAGVGGSRSVEGAISAIEGDFRRQRLWPKQLAGVREKRVRVVPANRAETGEREGIRGTSEAMGRGTNFRLAGPISPEQQGLRAEHGIERGDALYHDESCDAPSPRSLKS